MKTYRFALYGLTSSGKTCILAALDMNRVPTDYTVARLPVSVPPPPGNRKDWGKDDHVAGLHRGRDWLDKAIVALKKVDIPEPASISNDDLIIFEYIFTSKKDNQKDNRIFYIELNDYPGEYVNPNVADQPQPIHLRKRLEEMDGLLVLAALPQDPSDIDVLIRELKNLEAGFAGLCKEKKAQQGNNKLDLPVALLINKWDRISTNPPNMQGDDIIGLIPDEYKNYYRNLCQSLKAHIAFQGNFEVFSVSAFGEYEPKYKQDPVYNKRNRVDYPKSVEPLKSFGLEDGFIWLVKRRDEIDRISYEEEVNKFKDIEFGPAEEENLEEQSDELLGILH